MDNENGKALGVAAFARAVSTDWFTRMSGPLSVPAAFLTLWLSNDAAKIVAGITAFVCLWATAYGLWRKEREQNLVLQTEVGPLRVRAIEAQEAQTKALERQAEAIEKQNRENDPIVKRIRAKQEQDLQPPKPQLRLSFDMIDAGCVCRNTVLTERTSSGNVIQKRCDWYRIRIDAEHGNVPACQARLISVTRGGSPLLAGEAPPLPITHATEGIKTVHQGVPDYIDLLAIFETNTVDLCVPQERRSSSINWGMFDLASDYEIKVAVTAPAAETASINVIFRWTLDRVTLEIACAPKQ
jgi:hypothetical protein